MTAKPEKDAEKSASQAPGRTAYQRPSLRRLGSVRELTLGGTRGIFNEGPKMKEFLK
jgi:hypothetical protein